MDNFEVYGYAGKILRVNLSTKKIFSESIEKYARRFIGGRGINQWILFSELNPDINCFDPENLIIYGVGPLVGTLAPGACRVSIDTKNAFSGGVGSANCGGHFGPELKFAGFDHVVICGKAERPTYLLIKDDKAELKNASSIWGRTTWESEKIIKEDQRDEDIKVSVIGPAGENLVRAACIITDRAKAAGGSGVGAIMGSKNLKALAVRGSKSIEVAKPEKFEEAIEVAWTKVNSSPAGKLMRDETVYGGWCSPDSKIWELGVMPVRNGQDDFWETRKREKISGTVMKRYRKRILACFGCPVGCMPFFDLKEGPYAGTKGEGFWINSAMSYATRFDVDNPQAVIACHLLANQLGLDGDNAAVVISWAFECYEHGLLTKTETDGLELEWGNHDALMKMIEKLAFRDGIGDFLADGVKIASEKLGKGSEAYAIQIKGQDSLDGIRLRKAFALGVVTAPCAGRHLRGAIGTLQQKGDQLTYEGQARQVFWQEQYKAVQDMIGVCVLLGLTPENYAKLTSSATGMDLSASGLMCTGRQVHNIEKAFNTLHKGFTRKDDFPPRRYMEESVKSGPHKGERLRKEEWERMLDEYYALHGWSKETGWQTRECLEKLGLTEVAEKLKKFYN